MLFADLNLSPLILRALEIEGYANATPIQAQAIPHALAGRDVLGSAQTGTGKTAAFALPILNQIALAQAAVSPDAKPVRRRPTALVLCPTRELAAQIGAGFKAYGREVKARYCVIFGGVSQFGQTDSLRSGVDVVIATPGRLLDLMNQGYVDLSSVQTLVLDEADRMLDMGFIHDIKRIVQKLPAKRQTLLFSATMPTEIRRFANEMMNNPVRVEVTPVSTVAANIDEKVYYIAKGAKPQLLAHLVKDLPMHRAIVFMRTKHGADRIVRKLEAFGIRSAAIHGNKSQNNRSRALQLFKSDKIGVLVATDIAARGIDIDGVSHVINYDVTHEPETYVHRIGRTARAGASGVAISFCDHDERQNLTAIERLIKRKIALVPTPMADLPPAVADPRDGADRRYDDRERGPSHRTGGGVRNSSPRPSFIADRQPERSFGGERHSERAPARREPAQYMGDRRDTGDRREPSRNGGERREPSRGAAPRNYSSDRPAPRAYTNGGSNAPRPASPVKAKPRAFQAAPTAHVRHPLNGVKPTGAKQVHAQQVRSNGPVGSGTKKPHRKGQSRAPGRPHSHASR